MKNKILGVQYEIDTLKSDIQYKVEKSDINDLRELIEKRYAPKVDVDGVKTALNTYARVSSLKLIEQDLKGFISE